MSGRRLVILAVTIALGACGACSKSSSKPDTKAAPPPAGSDKGSEPETAGPVETGSDDSFQLVVATPDAVAAGAQAVAGLTILPGKGYHINAQLEPKLTLTAPDGVTLAKDVLTAQDATIERHTTTAGTEHIEVFDKVSFQIQATAKTAGSYTVPGKVKFAVCTDDNSDCEPKRRAVSFTVTAK